MNETSRKVGAMKQRSNKQNAQNPNHNRNKYKEKHSEAKGSAKKSHQQDNLSQGKAFGSTKQGPWLYQPSPKNMHSMLVDTYHSFSVH